MVNVEIVNIENQCFNTKISDDTSDSKIPELLAVLY